MTGATGPDLAADDLLVPDPSTDARLPSWHDLERTGNYLLAAQEPSGAIPWEPGRHVDVWDHVECAMALNVLGRHDAADAAYRWLRRSQRPDGSWPIQQTAGVVEDAGADTNQCAYLAVGVWHHWLVRSDRDAVAQLWPTVRRALDFVAARQLPFGGMSWAQGIDGIPAADALVTSSASIWQALGCGIELAGLLGEEPGSWPAVRHRLGLALREREGDFQPKPLHSMDWFYPVLTGVVRGCAGEARIAARWDEFVVPGLGVRCVADRPWVTGAETCELAMALVALGDRPRATRLVVQMQHLREDDGSYHTGYVYPDRLRWPIERSTWTAAAVVLAMDAIEEHTGGAGIFGG